MAATATVTPREWDAQGSPIAPAAPAREWDSAGNPVTSPQGQTSRGGPPAPSQSALSELVDIGKLGTSLIFSRLLGSDPHFAYQNHDEIAKRLTDIGGDFKSRMGKAAEVKDDPLYMMMKHKGPEPFESHDMLENFVHDASEFVGDPFIWAPALIGALYGKGRMGADVGFAVDSGLRKALADHYTKGTATSFGEIASRVGASLWEATKGAAIGEAMHFSGGLPAGNIPFVSTALRGAYQAAGMEVAGSILNLHMPSFESFKRNAVMVGGMGLIAHTATAGLTALAVPDVRQALIDVYAKDGTPPEQASDKVQAQPPVKPEPKPGLQPAIKLTANDGSEGVISGEYETHADLAESRTGSRPVSIDQLEADSKLADRVLDRPETHEQAVIDKAMELSASLGGLDDKAYYKNSGKPPKSGRGFQTPDGRYLSRSQAKSWVRENEPEVYDMWKDISGDEKSEMHSKDYQEARKRVAARNVMEGENAYSAMSPEQAKRLAAFREDLNQAKANVSDKDYAEQLRTFIVGQKDIRTAIVNNLRRSMLKVLPDPVDRQALTFMRDYKGNEQDLYRMYNAIKNNDTATLQSRLDLIKNQDVAEGFEKVVDEKSIERLRQAIPAIERALTPTDAMKSVDAELTKYATATLDEARGLGILDSSIPPDKYITHILREADAEEATGGLSRPKLATRTPYGEQRTYPTTIDAMIGGKVPRTLDALDAIVVYGDRHAIAAATRLFATELKNSELGKWGTGRNVPAGWAKVGDGRLFEYHGTDEDGKPFTTSLYAPKKIADAIRPITERKVLFQSGAGKKFRNIQSHLKAAFVGLSVFHANALTHSAINNMGIDSIKVINDSINSPKFQKLTESWSADGLITARSRTPYEVYRGMEGVSALDTPSRMDVVRNIYGIKQLNQLAEATTHFTFDVIQTKYKVTDASLKEAAWLAKHPNATDAEHFAARRSIAKEVNAVYGGLNWEALGWGPNAVELLRAIMLAPDWSFSNVYSLKYALPKKLGGMGGDPGGKAARMFWFRSATNGIALTQATSLFISGRLSSNPTQVYLGKDDKGKEMYSSWYFAGAPKDFATQINAWHRSGAITGTAEFLSYKLGPLVGTGPRLMVNKDWSGKPIVKKGQSFGEKTLHSGEFVAGELLPAPFAAKTAAQMLVDPDKDYTLTDFISGLAGAPVYHRGGPQSKKFHLPGSGGRGKGFRLPR